MPDVKITRRPQVIAAVILSMAMVAIEATIVSTAMPQIVGQVGGLTYYSWVFSSFLLTQTAATVVFGKLSDIFGRKPTLLVGLFVFMSASLLCGFAWSMPSLIAFRFLQGVGAGCVQPVTQTIVGDLYSADERGRVQGWLSSVWALSAVVGPLVGAVIIAHVSWSWIFWINIPFGILAAIGFVLFLHEGEVRARTNVDVPGAILFTCTVGALMILLTEISEAPPGRLWLLGGVFVVSGVLLFLQERRARDPVISFELWSRRPIAAANGAALLAGMALIGLTSFLPMYVQGVLQRPPVVAGLALTAVMAGWPTGAISAVRLYRRYGLRAVLIAGSCFLPFGAMALLFLSPGISPFVAGTGSFLMGVGMGLLTSAAIVMIQEITTWAQRGSATASNVFSRNLGSTLGAAVYGAVLNVSLAHAGAPVTSRDLQETMSAGGSDAMRALLQSALHTTFWAMFLTALAAVAVAAMVPYVPIGRTRETSAARELDVGA